MTAARASSMSRFGMARTSPLTRCQSGSRRSLPYLYLPCVHAFIIQNQRMDRTNRVILASACVLYVSWSDKLSDKLLFNTKPLGLLLNKDFV